MRNVYPTPVLRGLPLLLDLRAIVSLQGGTSTWTTRLFLLGCPRARRCPCDNSTLQFSRFPISKPPKLPSFRSFLASTHLETARRRLSGSRWLICPVVVLLTSSSLALNRENLCHLLQRHFKKPCSLADIDTPAFSVPQLPNLHRETRFDLSFHRLEDARRRSHFLLHLHDLQCHSHLDSLRRVLGEN